ncbi:hypothetical protein C4K23_3876 [Pseudomonas chlororaphis]|nr:hypothetical protein C4K23_3876 [Pseudomonas chlororaphis]
MERTGQTNPGSGYSLARYLFFGHGNNLRCRASGASVLLQA